MMHTCIVTVGTSLVGNLQRNNIEHEQATDWLYHMRVMGAKKACAETNSIMALVESGKLQRGDELVFIASHTEMGLACAEAISRFFAESGFVTTVCEVMGLNYKESGFKTRGLHELTTVLVEQVGGARRRGHEVLINATGGFKAETAYATTVGLLLGVPVYYLHEQFQDIIELPVVPISWDYSLLAENEDFFAWIRIELRSRREVEKRLAKLPEKIRAFLTEEEGYIMLSPAGEVFYAAYAEKLEAYQHTPVLLSGVAAEQYKNMEPSQQRKFARILQQIRVPEYREQMVGQVHNSDCRVYPKGHRSERVFFYDKDGGVYICELTRHSTDTYENAMDRGVKKGKYSGFKEFVE